MPVKPIKDNLYVIPIDSPEKIGSIDVPDSARRRTTQGIVKYRGPLTSGEIRVGDHVFFSGYTGDLLVIEGEGPLIVFAEQFVDALWEEGDDVHVLTLDQVKHIISAAAGEVSSTFPNDPHKQNLINTIALRMKGHIDSQFIKELRF